MDLLASIIQGKCSLERMLFFNKKYDISLPEDGIFNDIVMCDVKNIKCSPCFYINKVQIEVEFDLIITYEYYKAENKREILYGIMSEKAIKCIKIGINDYGIALKEFDTEMRSINRLYNINVLKDFEVCSNEFEISVYGTFESFVTKDEIIGVSTYLKLFNSNNDFIGNSIGSRFDENTEENSLYQEVTLIESTASKDYEKANSLKIARLEEEIILYKNRIRNYENRLQAQNCDLGIKQAKIIHLENLIEEKQNYIQMLVEQVEYLEAAMSMYGDELRKYTEERTKKGFLFLELMKSRLNQLINLRKKLN